MVNVVSSLEARYVLSRCLLAIAKQFHFTLHAYSELGYVAVDLFAFNRTLPLTQFMKSLRQSFGSEKVKATTVQRGDFGNERDMKPRRKTKITHLVAYSVHVSN